MSNAFKIPTQKPTEPRRQQSGSGGGGMFSALDKLLNLDSLFEKGVPLELMPKVLYATAFVIVYIANGHYAERNARKIDKLKSEVEDLRADYITMKSEYMFKSKQSEVAKKAESMGIYESSEPATKILISR